MCDRRQEDSLVLIHEYDWCQITDVLEILAHNLSLWLGVVIF